MPTYTVHLHHRNGNPNKSQWIIPPPEEVNCFQAHFKSTWKTEGWGIHQIGHSIQTLGVCKRRLQNLFIAKFVCKNPQNDWHGYPADHVENEQDRPSTETLKELLQNPSISAAKLRKIARGLPCDL